MSDHERDRLEQLAGTVLAAGAEGETEIMLATGESYLTRFAGNRIHQNVGSRGATAVIRTVADKRIGVAQAESLEADALRETLERAREIAAVRPPLEDFRGLPRGGKVRPVDAYDAATAACSPQDRAEMVAALVEAAKRRKAEAAGLVETRAGGILVANSRGVRGWHPSTSARFQTVVTCGDGSGYAEDQSFALGNLDAKRVIRDGVGKAARSRKPRPIDAGEYDVVLEPAAVGTMLQMLGYAGFGAKAFQEGRSFMSGRLGQKVTGDQISIVDNVHHRRLRGTPFDFEGVPTRRVKLIDRGVAAGVVYDSYLAGREPGRRASTGHAVPATYASYGAMPRGLVMTGGTESLRGLISSVQRGLLVTRFHYVNIAERMKAVITGMTRDGTFSIEGGRVAHPVRNLRFTESVLEAFERAEGITRMRRVAEGQVLCPAVKIRGFRFTGTTEF